jgi:NaMN:DMB phosphoribosyltransferase
MKRLIGIVAIAGSLVGCATPQQTAVLTGAVVGAAVMSSVYAHPAPRPLHCYTTRSVIGYDIYNRPLYQHRQVCR